MEDHLSPVDSMSDSPAPDLPLTVSPADTSLEDPEVKIEEDKEDEKKPAKKRKSWGQELPTPKTNLPPRKRAKTEDEKEQRRIERVLRNRAAAQTSRERKRLEMEKLENEKIEMAQTNQLLAQRLAQMEAENTRLNKQIAQLSAEVRGSSVSQGHSPKATSPAAPSPTLTPTLFKQEEDLPLERVAFHTPSSTEDSPTMKPSSLAESSDMAQHPAAVLCGLQCQSADSKETERSPCLTSEQATSLTLQMMLQLLFLTMTSAAYSAVVHPMSQILLSLKAGSPLIFSTEEIYRHFPLILWLISTPSLSPSRASTHQPVFRMRLLTRLLACNPALARPLRDATGRVLQLAVRERFSDDLRSVIDDPEGRRFVESLLTLAWAIDHLDRTGSRRNSRNSTLKNESRPNHCGKPRSTRGSRRLDSGKSRPSRLGKFT